MLPTLLSSRTMKKQLLLAPLGSSLLLTLVTIHCAQGQVWEKREFFDFNDAAGKTFGTSNSAGWSNSGTLNSVWNFGVVTNALTNNAMATDGSGQMVINDASGQTFRKLPGAGTTNAAAGSSQYANPFTNGVYRLELNIASWNFANAPSASNRLDFTLQTADSGNNVAGIRVNNVSNNVVRVQLIGSSSVAGNQTSFRNFEYGLVQNTPLSFAVEFDYENLIYRYYTNNAVFETFTNFGKAPLGTMVFSTANTWDSNNVVSIDSMGYYQQIPEPSAISLLLLGALGAGAWVLKRRKA